MKIQINIDGGDDSDSALYVDGYADNPDTHPDPSIPRDVIIDALVRADALGIDPVCHRFGDGAVRIMLARRDTGARRYAQFGTRLSFKRCLVVKRLA